MTTGKVYVGMSAQNTVDISGAETVLFEGRICGNVGVQIQHIAPINKGEVVWTLSAFDVLLIGRFFNTGKSIFRIVAVTGSEIVKRYMWYCCGARLDSILGNNVKKSSYNQVL